MRNPKKRMIICLDEVDQIKFSIKDEILYNLTAIRLRPDTYFKQAALAVL
jgi:Cdc6-like AAA superfamily ATPase